VLPDPKLIDRLVISSDDAFLSISVYTEPDHRLEIHGFARHENDLISLLAARKTDVEANFAAKFQLSIPESIHAQICSRVTAEMAEFVEYEGVDWYAERKMLRNVQNRLASSTNDLPKSTSVSLKHLKTELQELGINKSC